MTTDSTVRLVGSNGHSVTLLDSVDSLMREPGGSGWGMVPVANSWFEGAGDGAQLRGTRRTQRVLTIPVSAFGTNRQGVEDQLRALSNTIHDPFTIFVDFADGRSYYIPAVYESGAAGTYGANPNRQASWPLVFKCGDPYWTSVQAQSFIVAPAAGTPFLPLLAGLHVTSSVAQGQVTVVNNGDVASRPTWTIHGPGDHLSITVGGIGIVLPSYTLTSTTVITVQYVNGGWTITDEAGVNLYASLGTAPYFIEFPPGTSLVDISMLSATSTSFIQAVYPERREVVY